MKRNLQFNEAEEKSLKKKKINQTNNKKEQEENETSTPNYLNLLDFNCLQIIFLYLPNLEEKIWEKMFLDYICFSKTSQTFYETSKEIIFEPTILQKKTSIPFPIFKYIAKIPYEKFTHNESLLLFCIENDIPNTIIPYLKAVGIDVASGPSYLLSNAIQNDDLKLVKSLLSFGIDVNQIYPMYNNQTPLLKAARYGKLEIVKYLIESGADKNATNKYINNSLMLAVLNSNDINLVKYLISLDIDKTCANKYGNNCVILASLSGKLETLKYLISAGFNTTHLNNSGNNCLMQAVLNGELDVVKYLISIGFDRNFKDRDSDNFLTAACIQRELPLVEYLLSIGFDKNYKNNSNKTALDIAREKNFIEIVEFLENTEKPNL